MRMYLFQKKVKDLNVSSLEDFDESLFSASDSMTLYQVQCTSLKTGRL